MMQLKGFLHLKLFIYICLLSTYLTNIPSVCGQGLFFKGNGYLIEERTSYRVFENINPTFKDSMLMSFTFSPEYDSNIGYIFRIKTQDPALTFNLSYYAQGQHMTYKLNEEGKNTLITIDINKEDNRGGSWQAITLKLDLHNQTISFSVAGIHKSSSITLPQSLQPEIYFGKSDYFIDLPSFSIRNLTIADKKQRYRFQFREHENNIVHTENGAEVGIVENPTWLINKAYNWYKKTSFRSATIAGFNFDSIVHKIYYYNTDSIIAYDLIRDESQVTNYTNPSPITPKLGYNFLDARNQKLYPYEVVASNTGEVTLAQYDLQNKHWSSISTEGLPKQLHHHGKFFDEKNNRLIIFGGFGHMYYNNEFNCYNLETNNWEKLKFTGDTIFPRYFLSMGYNKHQNSLYIFGGMGNESGEYNVGRKYFYDLYQINLNEMHITKLWEIPWNRDHVVPVKSMLVTDDHFMTLCYPEHFSNTHLKLYRFSIQDGSFEILGDSIPIRSEKIKTNADLFYSREMSTLYGVVQEFDNEDIGSTLSIYSLLTPAVSYSELMLSGKQESTNLLALYWILASIGIAAVLFVYYKIKLRKNNRIPKTTSPNLIQLNNLEKTDKIESSNSIYLFGDFTVYDKNGKDISYMFSTRLKQTFLLILGHSLEDGISTQRLTASLWNDRGDERAKNIRGVTINSLRKLFEEMDGISLVYEKSNYKILIDEIMYCDYVKCNKLLDRLETKDDIEVLLDILSRGKLLKNDEDPIYDALKSSLEGRIEPILLQLVTEHYKKENQQTVISLCESIFNIDPISDSAISFLINAMEELDMQSEARKRFFKFIIEYKNMIGEEYPKDYLETKKAAIKIN